MAIVTHHPLLLHDLRYVPPARIKVWQGAATLRSGGVSIELRQGESFTVPSFVRFSCLAYPRRAPGMARPAVWSLALEMPADASAGMARIECAADASKPWTRQLADAIFRQPATDWNAAHVASLWQLTPARLRARLFAEGESLSCLVREQRVAWLLARLADMDGAPAGEGHAGFASAMAAARACQDVIGLPPEVTARVIALHCSTRQADALVPSSGQRQPRYRRYF